MKKYAKIFVAAGLLIAMSAFVYADSSIHGVNSLGEWVKRFGQLTSINDAAVSCAGCL